MNRIGRNKHGEYKSSSDFGHVCAKRVKKAAENNIIIMAKCSFTAPAHIPCQNCVCLYHYNVIGFAHLIALADSSANFLG